jgi:hypothetical protein
MQNLFPGVWYPAAATASTACCIMSLPAFRIFAYSAARLFTCLYTNSSVASICRQIASSPRAFLFVIANVAFIIIIMVGVIIIIIIISIAILLEQYFSFYATGPLFILEIIFLFIFKVCI